MIGKVVKAAILADVPAHKPQQAPRVALTR